ncbi:hypothetical protein OF83DRAFT_1170555 [Amylostereum chailletii]|nr:hypothetical protein OF83DRAFT_1170555 [Amylostereum chailletii]
MSNTSLIPQLPAELFAAILEQVPQVDLQHTTAALIRALPRSPVPRYFLFLHIRLKTAEKVVQFGRYLRTYKEDAKLVNKFSLEAWTVDANVAVNLILQLPNLEWLSLFVGPNFAPEHLEELFEKPMIGLKFLSLRFRPYVQKATYYQFLKGAYFDSSLLALSRWPAADMPSLSIMQDPLDPSIAPTRFAQPLVFFRLDPLATLGTSELLENVTNYRIRIPARQISRYIGSSAASTPAVDFLDLSTCSMSDGDVVKLVQRFSGLRHLVVDKCNIVHSDAQSGDWATFGRALAMTGVQRQKEREKQLRQWLTAMDDGAANAPPIPVVARPRAKKGRKGLATATISLRDKTQAPAPLPVPPRQGPSSHSRSRARILPPTPTIRTVSTTTPMHVSPTEHDAIRAEFARGWGAGLLILSSIRRRLRQSARNGMHMVRFATIDDDEFSLSEQGFDGLVDVVDQSDREFGEVDPEMDEGQVPLLCLAGPGEREGYEHLEQCGHKVGWNIWEDKL